jgi:hypothetical protein
MPYPLPLERDETLYSGLARAWTLAGCPPIQIFKQLLNLPCKHRIHSYLPAYLQSIGEIITVSPEVLLMRHTLYPIFACILRNPTELSKSMFGSGVPSPTLLSRIPHVGMHQQYSMKYCPVCADEERVTRGFAIWHLVHQMPGVMACIKHKVQLHSLLLGDDGLDRQFRMVPRRLEQKIIVSSPIAISVATAAEQFLKFCQGNAPVNVIKTVIQPKLASLGMYTNAGYIRLAALKTLLIDTYGSWLECQQDELPLSWRQFEFVDTLFREKTGFVSHPLKYALVFAALSKSSDMNTTETHNNKEHSTLPTEQVLSLAARGISLNMIAKQFSVSRCKVRRIVELGGVKHASNSLSYAPSLRRSAVMKAILGIDRQSIAASLNVGIGYVEQVISNTPGVSSWRSTLKHNKKVKLAVEALRYLRDTHNDLSRTQIREKLPAQYALLYKENKELLFSLLPQKKAPIPPGR